MNLQTEHQKSFYENSFVYEQRHSPLLVNQAVTEFQLNQVRELMNEFVYWLRQRYWDETDFIDDYFDPDNFRRELAELPGSYSPPPGRLLLAELNRIPVGCVAFRNLGNKVCEMKRLFVAARSHGNGVGKALVQSLLTEAKKEGYRCMRLDTGYKQLEAQRLYQKFGFRMIQPYYDLPESVKRRLVFMEILLQK